MANKTEGEPQTPITKKILENKKEAIKITLKEEKSTKGKLLKLHLGQKTQKKEPKIKNPKTTPKTNQPPSSTKATSKSAGEVEKKQKKPKKDKRTSTGINKKTSENNPKARKEKS